MKKPNSWSGPKAPKVDENGKPIEKPKKLAKSTEDLRKLHRDAMRKHDMMKGKK